MVQLSLFSSSAWVPAAVNQFKQTSIRAPRISLSIIRSRSALVAKDVVACRMSMQGRAQHGSLEDTVILGAGAEQLFQGVATICRPLTVTQVLLLSPAAQLCTLISNLQEY